MLSVPFDATDDMALSICLQQQGAHPSWVRSAWRQQGVLYVQEKRTLFDGVERRTLLDLAAGIFM
eukprot:3138432-Amphidinium_carterae.1